MSPSSLPRIPRPSAPGPDPGDRLDRLERDLVRIDHARRRWRTFFAISTVAFLVTAAVAWATISSVVNTYYGASGQVDNYDTTKFVIVIAGELVNALATAATGNTSAGAIEMTLALGAANTALAVGDWYYQATVKEVGIATVTSGTYKVELFQDGTSLGALYMKQATSDPLNVEGVTFKWSLGAALPTGSAFTLKVS